MSSPAALMASSAFATEFCRCSPPSTTRSGLPNFSLSICFWKPAASFLRSATTISLTASQAANLRKVCTRMGVPCSSKNCLLLLLGPPETADIRVPSPAAGMITTTFIRAAEYKWRGGGNTNREKVGGCRQDHPPVLYCPPDQGLRPAWRDLRFAAPEFTAGELQIPRLRSG